MTLHPAFAVGSTALVVVAVMIVPTAAPAAPATIRGTVNPAAAGLPKSAKAGSAQVSAMNIDTAAFGDSARVSRSGHYSLQLPPGKWALGTSVVALGKPVASFLSAAIVTRAGQQRTLPLTLKQFKKPRKRHRKHGHKHRHRATAHASNINPRDGRPYKGEAYAVLPFEVIGGNADLRPMGKGMADLVTTDLIAGSQCDYTMVEWARRDEIEKEVALQQSEWFDPATRVEPGHFIDPDIFVRGRVEDRPGTPHRVAVIAWLEDARTGAKISGDVSAVGLDDNLFDTEQRLQELIIRDLICARVKPPPSAEPASPPPPKPVANTYSGSFSGTADAIKQHWTWSGNLDLDAAQDTNTPPNGAPPGSYRIFSITQGGLDVQTTGGDANCGWSGDGHLSLIPGFSNGSLWVQLDTDTPAYSLTFADTRFITVTRSGTDPNCTGTLQLPMPQPWAYTEKAHTSSSTTLSDSEAHITPETYDFDYTTSWSLAPG